MDALESCMRGLWVWGFVLGWCWVLGYLGGEGGWDGRAVLYYAEVRWYSVFSVDIYSIDFLSTVNVNDKVCS